MSSSLDHASRLPLSAAVISMLVVVSISESVLADPGSLDSTFGADGKVTTSFGRGSARLDGIAIQADGRIVAAGTWSRRTTQIVLARYQTDGALDPTFGGDGRVRVDFPRGIVVKAVAIQADGRIVVAGSSASPFDSWFALARFTTDGSLDPSFGRGGRLTTDFRRGAAAYDVAIQADGKIVALGTSGLRFALVRYNTDGSMDRSFGRDGKVLTDIADGDDVGYGVAIQPDGRIVAAGKSGCDFAMARYTDEGSLDATFGVGGKATSDFGFLCEFALDVLVQSDGKVLTAGFGQRITGFDFVLARYDSDGTPDAGFAADGRAQAGFADAAAYEIAVQVDGEIIAAGTTQGADGLFALARFRPDGSLDTSFGDDGRITTPIGQLSGAFAVGLQEDGNILAGGGSTNRRMSFALARYLAA